MDVTLEKPSTYLRKVYVTLPSAVVDQAFEKTYRELAKQAAIPGFRPGKAPKSLLDKHFGGRVSSDVQSRLVQDSLFKALGEKNENPIDMPKVEPGALKQGHDFSYSAEFEVQPEVKLTTYKGLEIPAVDMTIDNSAVDEQLESMRKQQGTLVPVTGRTTAQTGDTVTVDFFGTMDGKPLAGGQAENALVEIGGENYIPGFAEGLVGVEVPGKTTLNLTFPADYSVADLAGKPVTFDITTKELKAKKTPELDDEFAKDMGEESLLALRGKIRTNLEEQKAEAAKEEKRQALMKALAAANPFDLPPSMVRNQSERMIDNATQRLMQYTGRKINLSPAEIQGLHASNQAEAELMVRSGLLLLEVAKAEKLEATDAEVDAEITKMVAPAGDQAERMRAAYNDPNVKQQIKYRVLEDKVMEMLLSNAKETKVEKKSDEK